MTVAAFGTSAPELAVGITGQMSQKIDIGLGNIVGSNIFNILFVLGLAALINPLPSGGRPSNAIYQYCWAPV
jgi:cation:H+ antiporter